MLKHQNVSKYYENACSSSNLSRTFIYEFNLDHYRWLYILEKTQFFSTIIFRAAIYGKIILHTPLSYFSQVAISYISIYIIDSVYFYSAMQFREIFLPVGWYKHCILAFPCLFSPLDCYSPPPTLLANFYWLFLTSFFFRFTFPVLHTVFFMQCSIACFKPTFYILQYRVCR